LLIADFEFVARKPLLLLGKSVVTFHHDAAATSLIPALSCRSCRPNAPFAELVRLSRTTVADEMREEYRRRVLGE
jgi:hypothetical protein